MRSSVSTFDFTPRAPRTVMGNDFVVTLPERSVAVQTTVVVPMANVLPEDGRQECVTPGQLSLDELVKTTAAPASLVNSAMMPAGTVSDGACASITLTVCEQVEELPNASVAVQVMVVMPTG